MSETAQQRIAAATHAFGEAMAEAAKPAAEKMAAFVRAAQRQIAPPSEEDGA